MKKKIDDDMTTSWLCKQSAKKMLRNDLISKISFSFFFFSLKQNDKFDPWKMQLFTNSTFCNSTNMCCIQFDKIFKITYMQKKGYGRTFGRFRNICQKFDLAVLTKISGFGPSLITEPRFRLFTSLKKRNYLKVFLKKC